MKKFLIAFLLLCFSSPAFGADTKVVDETPITSVAGEDLLYIVDDPGGTPLDRKATITQIQTFVNSGNAATATALAANGSNCSAGNYPLGVDASGAIESCTDATTEIDSAISTHAGNASAHHTATVDTNLNEEEVEDFVGGMLGGTETRISVTYDDAANAINYVVDDMNDDQPDSDAEVPDALTIAGGNIATTDIILEEQGAGDPTVDGDIEWDTTSETLKVGDDGVATKEFFPGGHTTNTNADTICTGTDNYLDGDGNCDVISGGSHPVVDTTSIVEGSVDNTKEMRIEVDGLTTGTVRVLTMPDGDVDLGNILDAYIPNNITIDLAAAATALAANGGNCAAGSYPLGVDASGAIESCTDATTEIDSAISTHAGLTATHGAAGAVVGTTNTQTLANKTFTDSTTTLQDEADTTKKAKFQLSGIATATTRTITVPDASGTMAFTSSNVATATALAANGGNCSAGSYSLGVNASGAAESCTDATTEIDSAISTHAGNASAHHTATVDTTLDLGGAETITGNWVNTANPWAANEVVDAYILNTGDVGSGDYDFGGFLFTDGTNNRMALGVEEYSLTAVGATFDSLFSSHIEDGDGNETEVSVHRHSATAGTGALMYGSRSRGTEGSETAVADNDTLLRFVAAGHDGTDYNPVGAIYFKVDGTVGANDVGGEIQFLVTPDGSNALAEAMLISNDKTIDFSGYDCSGNANGGALTVDASGNVSCSDDDSAAPGADSIGTSEIDDGADTPGSGEYIRVDTVDQAGVEYRTTAEVLSDIGAEGTLTNEAGLESATGGVNIIVSTEIDTEAELEALSNITNILREAEIDASAELLAIMDDETGTGLLVFGTAPTFTTSITMGAATLSEAELEILDGATATTAELNKLAGAGTLKQAGKATLWIPAAAMRPTVSNGSAALVDVETTAGRPDMTVLDFDTTADEHVQFQAAFPKSWNLGTITFQGFWTTAGAVTTGIALGLQGVCVPDNSTIDVVHGTAVVVTDDAQSTAEEAYVTSESGNVTLAGTPADDDICFFRAFRDVSDANDDMTQDMRLIGIKLFYTTDLANDD